MQNIKKILGALIASTLLFSNNVLAQDSQSVFNFHIVKNVEIWFVVAFFLIILFIIHNAFSKGNKQNRQLFEERQEKKLQRQEEEDYYKHR